MLWMLIFWGGWGRGLERGGIIFRSRIRGMDLDGGRMGGDIGGGWRNVAGWV